MNRFRTKKKAKAADDSPARPSHESAAPAMTPLKPAMTFRRKKDKTEPAPRMELDLVNALPASDDFRTSLLMTGLSARFSMLREQDDPKSKIGKASDDSVLFPKRQSRLNDFGFTPQGLSDIAEVGSIRESTRRPFALDRMDSFQSSAGSSETDAQESIMSRGKPAEGNNLFGGRQKIYKIPMGGSTSMKSLNGTGESGGLGGRALYGDDVSQSAFQKLKEREREEREREREKENERRSQEEAYRSESPPAGYNRNRETSSTTSSGPNGTRISTAATSVTSQRTPSVTGQSSAPTTPAVPGPERSFTTKTKRLYETGLDQHLHTQQFSAANRLDNLSRQGRNIGARSPSPAGSPVPSPMEGQSSTGRQPRVPLSSPTSPIGGFDFGTKPTATKDALKPFVTTPPLSSPVSETEDKSGLPIQPNDKGKATSLGAFTKPVQPYDERKYTQRQLQMQQGRETPPLRKHAPPPSFLPNAAAAQDNNTAPLNRAESNATSQSDRSRESSTQREFAPRERMFPPKREPPPEPLQQQVAAPPQGMMGSFLTSPGDSSAASSPRGSAEEGKVNAWEQAAAYDEFEPRAAAPAPLVMGGRRVQAEHPALRKGGLRLRELDERGQQQTVPRPAPQQQARLPSKAPEDVKVEKSKVPAPADSPTLPASGLSGIIRQHLRSESNTSSIGGPPSPVLAPQYQAADYTMNGNPWDDHPAVADNNDWAPHPTTTTTTSSPAPTPTHSHSTPRAASPASSDTPSWEKAINHHHSRDASTESAREREDFASELAARRKRVQENLRSFAESDSRSQSPVRGGTETPPLSAQRVVSSGFVGGGAGASRSNHHLNFMKGRTSRDSLATSAAATTPRSRDSSVGPQSKARKMLGMGGGGGGTPPGTMYDDHPHPHAGHQQKQQQPRSHYDSDSAGGGGYASSTYDNNPPTPRSVPRSAAPAGAPPLPPTSQQQQQQVKNFRDKRRDAQRERERQVLNRHRAGTGGAAGGSDSDDYFGAAGRAQGQMRPQQRGGGPAGPHGGNGGSERHHHPAMRTRSPSRDAPPVSYRAPRAGSVESHGSGGGNSRPGTRERSGSNVSASGYSRAGAGGPRFSGDRGERGEGGERQRGGQEGLATISSPTFPPGGGAFGGSGNGMGNGGAPSPGVRSRSGSRSQAQQPFPAAGPMHLNLDAPGTAYSAANSPRPSPVVPFAVNSTPALVPAGGGSGATTPLTPSSSSASGGSAAAAAAAIAAASAAAAASAQMGAGKGRKRSVNKRDISDPVFVSSTNKVSTVELPTSPVKAAGGGPATTFAAMGMGEGGDAGGGNGGGKPEVPAMDPRRRTRTGMFWKRRDVSGEGADGSSPSTPTGTPGTPGIGGGEVLTSSVFEADDPSSAAAVGPRARQRLRKTSSEGGNLAARARAGGGGGGGAQGGLQVERVPDMPVSAGAVGGFPRERGGEGGMF
ncbi:hypothetical protein VE03_09768 [Pseudogymnoascus sp. 23342-1-I1]|nr:hypothetical protein VE03_09768 [Pseudogymnoascus sp. 23342-1-I1]